MGEYFYAFIKLLSNLLLNVFYSEIETVGSENIPDQGPILFVGTHPNALVDPLLILTNTKHTTRMIAKSQLFSVPILGSLLRGVGAIPVYR